MGLLLKNTLLNNSVLTTESHLTEFESKYNDA